MEEKSTKLNIMNRKVNLDFFKNMVPPINIQKLKSRKIFSSKVSEKFDTAVPIARPYTESTCVDRSPARISTISSLVDGAPEYDYSFGHISIPDSRIEMNPAGRERRPSSNDESPTRPMKLSEKLVKHYKDFSEFKFKHILGKRTIVRTTSIDVDNYSHRPEDLISERSDSEFEFHSLPAGTGMGRSFEDDIESTPEAPGSRTINRNSFTKSNPNPSENLEAVAKVKPNESSLWKHVNSISRGRSIQKSSESTVVNLGRSGGISKRSFSKQTLEDACNKARVTVTNKLQKIMNLPERITDSKPSSAEHESYKRNPDHDEALPRIYKDSTTSGHDRQYRSKQKSFGRPEANVWNSKPIAQNSHESEKSISRHCLKSDSAIDNIIERSVFTRRAPPIPPNQIVASKNQTIKTRISPDTRIIGLPRPVRSNAQEKSWRGHTRKPSAESIDSDSWIPDVFRGQSRNQINLEIIQENCNAWSMSKPIKGGLQKFESIDIFNSRGNEAFEDFDDALKNAPTIPVQKNSVKLKPKFETNALVKQSSIVEDEDDAAAAEGRTLYFSKLVNRFENSSKTVDEISSASLDSNSEHTTAFESKIMVQRWNRKEFDDDDGDEKSSLPWHIKELTSLKPTVNGRTLQLKTTGRNEKTVPSIDEEVEDDIFHSLDYNECISQNDSNHQFRRNSVKVVYAINL